MRASLFIIALSISLSVTANEALWQKLRNETDMVVVMRNAESFGNRDGGNMLTWDSSGNCIGESRLTPEGEAQAQLIGKAFDSRGVDPTVITSPMCRCKDTAAIAFGAFITHPALRQRPPENFEGTEELQSIASALLAKHRGKAPVVFVNHRPNIDALTLELLNIGELLVGKITAEGDIEPLGKIQLFE